MNFKDKCTPGEISSKFLGDRTVIQSKLDTVEFVTINHNEKLVSETAANSKLITEAFNVLNETGYTPRELADNFKTCLEHLENLVSAQYKGDAKLGKALVDSHTFAQQFKTK